MSNYIRYYEDQIGGGGIRNIYAGSNYQRGRGVGSWLGGLLRRAMPYIVSSAKAIGKEGVRAGLNVFNDVNNGEKFKSSVSARARESRKNLQKKAASKIADMMKGSGYKRRTSRRKAQSKKARAPARTTRKKSVKRKRAPARNKSRTVNNAKKRRKRQTTTRDITDILSPK